MPFVLSWSLLEAMACGCLIVASDGPPVREVIEPDRQGLLVDFFSPETLAAAVAHGLDHPNRLLTLRRAARQKIEDDFSLGDLLPKHIMLIRRLADRRVSELLNNSRPEIKFWSNNNHEFSNQKVTC